MTKLFYIYGKDFTERIERATYNVNRSDVYKEWTDANGTVHRDVTRTRIKGSFTIGFHKKTELKDFIAYMRQGKTSGGYYPVMLYLNNEDELVGANVFLDLTANVQRDVKNDRFFAVYSVEVAEC